MRNIIISSLFLAAAACGGAQKGSVYGSGGKNQPPPPPNVGASNDVAEPGKPAAAKVEVSADAKKDYQGAVEAFTQQDKSGKWSEGECKASADRFGAVVRQHPDLVAAQFMVGLSYQRTSRRRA
jgi:hypothetical protein